jgi:hypothetical protein
VSAAYLRAHHTLVVNIHEQTSESDGWINDHGELQSVVVAFYVVSWISRGIDNHAVCDGS